MIQGKFYSVQGHKAEFLKATGAHMWFFSPKRNEVFCARSVEVPFPEWIEPYTHVTELWIAEGAPVRCRFTGLSRDCQSKDEFPGAKKYRITTEEIV